MNILVSFGLKTRRKGTAEGAKTVLEGVCNSTSTPFLIDFQPLPDHFADDLIEVQGDPRGEADGALAALTLEACCIKKAGGNEICIGREGGGFGGTKDSPKKRKGIRNLE